MRNTQFNKFITWLIICAFLQSNAVYAVGNAPAVSPLESLNKNDQPVVEPVDIKEILDVNIPENFGTVKEKFTGPSDKVIVHVQDSHCNFESQVNFASILKNLKTGKFKDDLNLIAVEGATGEIDLSPFAVVQDDGVKDKIAQYFMKEGMLTGSEYYALFDKKPMNIFGIENEQLYVENYTRFLKTQYYKKDALRKLEEMKGMIKLLRGKVFGPDMLEVSLKSSDYEEGRMKFTEYCRYLRAACDKFGVDWKRYDSYANVIRSMEIEDKTNMQAVQTERAAFITELQKKMVKEELTELVKKSLLFRIGKISSADFYGYAFEEGTKLKIDMAKYKNFASYVEIVKVHEKVNPAELFFETDQILGDIKDKAIKNSNEKKFDTLLKNVRMTEKLLNLELTREDLVYIKEHKSDIDAKKFLEQINAEIKRIGLPIGLSADVASITDHIAEMEGFYKAAIERDDAIVQNTLAQMEKTGQKCCVVVTGGFHSKGVMEKFKAKGISYMVVTPRMTAKYDPAIYMSRMMDEETAFEKLLRAAGTRLNVPDIWARQGIQVVVNGKEVVDSNKKLEAAKRAIEVFNEGLDPSSKALMPVERGVVEMFMAGKVLNPEQEKILVAAMRNLTLGVTLASAEEQAEKKSAAAQQAAPTAQPEEISRKGENLAMELAMSKLPLASLENYLKSKGFADAKYAKGEISVTIDGVPFKIEVTGSKDGTIANTVLMTKEIIEARKSKAEAMQKLADAIAAKATKAAELAAAQQEAARVATESKARAAAEQAAQAEQKAAARDEALLKAAKGSEKAISSEVSAFVNCISGDNFDAAEQVVSGLINLKVSGRLNKILPALVRVIIARSVEGMNNKQAQQYAELIGSIIALAGKDAGMQLIAAELAPILFTVKARQAGYAGTEAPEVLARMVYSVNEELQSAALRQIVGEVKIGELNSAQQAELLLKIASNQDALTATVKLLTTMSSKSAVVNRLKNLGEPGTVDSDDIAASDAAMMNFVGTAKERIETVKIEGKDENLITIKEGDAIYDRLLKEGGACHVTSADGKTTIHLVIDNIKGLKGITKEAALQHEAMESAIEKDLTAGGFDKLPDAVKSELIKGVTREQAIARAAHILAWAKQISTDRDAMMAFARAQLRGMDDRQLDAIVNENRALHEALIAAYQPNALQAARRFASEVRDVAIERIASSLDESIARLAQQRLAEGKVLPLEKISEEFNLGFVRRYADDIKKMLGDRNGQAFIDNFGSTDLSRPENFDKALVVLAIASRLKTEKGDIARKVISNPEFSYRMKQQLARMVSAFLDSTAGEQRIAEFKNLIDNLDNNPLVVDLMRDAKQYVYTLMNKNASKKLDTLAQKRIDEGVLKKDSAGYIAYGKSTLDVVRKMIAITPLAAIDKTTLDRVMEAIKEGFNSSTIGFFDVFELFDRVEKLPGNGAFRSALLDEMKRQEESNKPFMLELEMQLIANSKTKDFNEIQKAYWYANEVISRMDQGSLSPGQREMLNNYRGALLYAINRQSSISWASRLKDWLYQLWHGTGALSTRLFGYRAMEGFAPEAVPSVPGVQHDMPEMALAFEGPVEVPALAVNAEEQLFAALAKDLGMEFGGMNVFSLADVKKASPQRYQELMQRLQDKGGSMQYYLPNLGQIIFYADDVAKQTASDYESWIKMVAQTLFSNRRSEFNVLNGALADPNVRATALLSLLASGKWKSNPAVYEFYMRQMEYLQKSGMLTDYEGNIDAVDEDMNLELLRRNGFFGELRSSDIKQAVAQFMFAVKARQAGYAGTEAPDVLAQTLLSPAVNEVLGMAAFRQSVGKTSLTDEELLAELSKNDAMMKKAVAFLNALKQAQKPAVTATPQIIAVKDIAGKLTDIKQKVEEGNLDNALNDINELMETSAIKAEDIDDLNEILNNIAARAPPQFYLERARRGEKITLAISLLNADTAQSQLESILKTSGLDTTTISAVLDKVREGFAAQSSLGKDHKTEKVMSRYHEFQHSAEVAMGIARALIAKAKKDGKPIDKVMLEEAVLSTILHDSGAIEGVGKEAVTDKNGRKISFQTYPFHEILGIGNFTRDQIRAILSKPGVLLEKVDIDDAAIDAVDEFMKGYKHSAPKILADMHLSGDRIARIQGLIEFTKFGDIGGEKNMFAEAQINRLKDLFGDKQAEYRDAAIAIALSDLITASESFGAEKNYFQMIPYLYEEGSLAMYDDKPLPLFESFAGTPGFFGFMDNIRINPYLKMLGLNASDFVRTNNKGIFVSFAAEIGKLYASAKAGTLSQKEYNDLKNILIAFGLSSAVADAYVAQLRALNDYANNLKTQLINAGVSNEEAPALLNDMMSNWPMFMKHLGAAKLADAEQKSVSKEIVLGFRAELANIRLAQANKLLAESSDAKLKPEQKEQKIAEAMKAVLEARALNPENQAAQDTIEQIYKSYVAKGTEGMASIEKIVNNVLKTNPANLAAAQLLLAAKVRQAGYVGEETPAVLAEIFIAANESLPTAALEITGDTKLGALDNDANKSAFISKIADNTATAVNILNTRNAQGKVVALAAQNEKTREVAASKGMNKDDKQLSAEDIKTALDNENKDAGDIEAQIKSALEGLGIKVVAVSGTTAKVLINNKMYTIRMVPADRMYLQSKSERESGETGANAIIFSKPTDASSEAVIGIALDLLNKQELISQLRHEFSEAILGFNHAEAVETAGLDALSGDIGRARDAFAKGNLGALADLLAYAGEWKPNAEREAKYKAELGDAYEANLEARRKLSQQVQERAVKALEELIANGGMETQPVKSALKDLAPEQKEYFINLISAMNVNSVAIANAMGQVSSELAIQELKRLMLIQKKNVNTLAENDFIQALQKGDYAACVRHLQGIINTNDAAGIVSHQSRIALQVMRNIFMRSINSGNLQEAAAILSSLRGLQINRLTASIVDDAASAEMLAVLRQTLVKAGIAQKSAVVIDMASKGYPADIRERADIFELFKANMTPALEPVVKMLDGMNYRQLKELAESGMMSGKPAPAIVRYYAWARMSEMNVFPLLFASDSSQLKPVTELSSMESGLIDALNSIGEYSAATGYISSDQIARAIGKDNAWIEQDANTGMLKIKQGSYKGRLINAFITLKNNKAHIVNDGRKDRERERIAARTLMEKVLDEYNRQGKERGETQARIAAFDNATRAVRDTHQKQVITDKKGVAMAEKIVAVQDTYIEHLINSIDDTNSGALVSVIKSINADLAKAKDERNYKLDDKTLLKAKRLAQEKLLNLSIARFDNAWRKFSPTLARRSGNITLPQSGAQNLITYILYFFDENMLDAIIDAESLKLSGSEVKDIAMNREILRSSPYSNEFKRMLSIVQEQRSTMQGMMQIAQRRQDIAMPTWTEARSQWKNGAHKTVATILLDLTVPEASAKSNESTIAALNMMFAGANFASGTAGIADALNETQLQMMNLVATGQAPEIVQKLLTASEALEKPAEDKGLLDRLWNWGKNEVMKTQARKNIVDDFEVALGPKELDQLVQAFKDAGGKEEPKGIYTIRTYSSKNAIAKKIGGAYHVGNVIYVADDQQGEQRDIAVEHETLEIELGEDHYAAWMAQIVIRGWDSVDHAGAQFVKDQFNAMKAGKLLSKIMEYQGREGRRATLRNNAQFLEKIGGAENIDKALASIKAFEDSVNSLAMKNLMAQSIEDFAEVIEITQQQPALDSIVRDIIKAKLIEMQKTNPTLFKGLMAGDIGFKNPENMNEAINSAPTLVLFQIAKNGLIGNSAAVDARLKEIEKINNIGKMITPRRITRNLENTAKALQLTDKQINDLELDKLKNDPVIQRHIESLGVLKQMKVKAGHMLDIQDFDKYSPEQRKVVIAAISKYADACGVVLFLNDYGKGDAKNASDIEAFVKALNLPNVKFFGRASDALKGLEGKKIGETLIAIMEKDMKVDFKNCRVVLNPLNAGCWDIDALIKTGTFIMTLPEGTINISELPRDQQDILKKAGYAVEQLIILKDVKHDADFLNNLNEATSTTEFMA